MNESILATHIEELEEDAALALVRERLDVGEDPFDIIAEAEEGMRRVGQRYQDGRYFIAGLIMAGEIFRLVIEMAQPEVEAQFCGEGSGRVLIGTVQGDIHDLGKNIILLLLRCHGFEVHDLGVDVPPAEFAARAAELRPDIVALSGLLTTSYNHMKTTVDLVRQTSEDWDYQPIIIIGGNHLDQQINDYIGADHWSTEAAHGIGLFRRLLSE